MKSCRYCSTYWYIKDLAENIKNNNYLGLPKKKKYKCSRSTNTITQIRRHSTTFIIDRMLGNCRYSPPPWFFSSSRQSTSTHSYLGGGGKRGTARVKCLNQENITNPGLVMLKPRPLQLELTLSLTIDRLVRRIQLRFLVSIYQIFV